MRKNKTKERNTRQVNHGGDRFRHFFFDYRFAFLSGILLVIIQPPISLWPLAYCALVPLFRTIDKENLKRSFLQGFVAGIVTWLGTIYWVVVAMNQYGGIIIPLSIVILLLFVVYLSLYMGIFVLACAFLERRASLPSYLSAPLIWVILEYLRGIVMTGFPWSYLGHSQYEFLPLIQITSVTGTFYISFLIVAANGIIHSLWKRRKVSIVYAAIVGILFGLSLAYGLARMSRHNDIPEQKTAIVQGNISQDIKWDESFKAMTVSKYLRLSFGLAQGADLIIWPETAIPFLIDRDAASYHYIRAVPKALKSRLLFGTVALDRSGGLLNTVHYVDKEGVTNGIYNKVHLVPFGEYTPIVSYFPLLAKITAAGADFKRGDGHRPIDTDIGKVGILICFEGIFPYITNESVRNGAQVLVNVTNDAWYNKTSAPYQHFSFYVFRAIETDRYVLRAANTGITGIIDPSGRIQGKTRIFTEDVLSGTYALKSTKTVYVRYGDYFIVMCLIILAGLVIAAATTRHRRS